MLTRKNLKLTNVELLELDANFLENITGIEKKYWKDGYINAPSFHKQFEKLKQEKQSENLTSKGFDAWTLGSISIQSLLYVHIIRNNNGEAFETIEELSKNVLDSKGFGKGSAINTIMLGITLNEQEKK